MTIHEILTELRMKWAAFAVLRDQLGLKETVRVGLAMGRRPDPFQVLPEPADDRDRDSRDQIRPSVNLYLELRARIGEDQALKVVRDVVLEASLAFLEANADQLDPGRYLVADPEGRVAMVNGVIGRFPNSDGVLEDVRDDGFVFRVTTCRFVNLCNDIGLSDLAPLYCRGDVAYFARGSVTLERPTTLAEGDPCCEFRFGLRENGRSKRD